MTAAAAFFFVFAAILPVRADNPADPRIAADGLERPQTVIVPYDPQKPVAEQKPDRLYVPYEEFLTLWQAAKEHRRGEAPEQAGVESTITSARYEGRVGEHVVTFTAKLDLFTGGADNWKKVPLPFQGAKLTAVTLDGQPAALNGEALMVEKPGRHHVEATFDVPLPAGAKEFKLGVPRAVAALVTLRLPQPGMTATIAPGSGSVEHVVDGVTEVVAALGSADVVQVTLGSAAVSARTAEPAEAQIRSLVRIDVGAEETVGSVAFSLPGAKQSHFAISFDAGLDLVDLDVPDLQSWKLHPDGDRQTLELDLASPVEKRLEAGFTVRRSIAGLPADGRVPVISASAMHVENISTALFARPSAELTPAPDGGVRQIAWDEPVPEGWTLAGAYAGSGRIGWHLAEAPTKREARIAYLYQVNRRQIELFASLELLSNGGDLYSTEISLPQGFLVQAVRSERLQDWWREGDRLHVRFRGSTPEVTPLVLYLVRQEAAAPASLEVRPLSLEGFRKVTGEAAIAAFKGVNVAMELSGGAREVAPERAATDYQVVPPLERKRGFTFTEQNFAAKVSLTPAPAKMLALWTMDAQAHEGWAALGAKVQLSLRQGSIDRVRFTLPTALPEVRVSGSDVRETRSTVEGANRVYDVQFQADVTDSVEFTFDTEIPNSGDLTLPALAFPDAQRATGYVMVDNASEGEMRIESSGVDSVPASEVPWLPDLSRNAQIFRVQPSWSVKVGVERLEKATARAAFCAWAELTTALRSDGTEWHRAIWHLQNRTLQYLPVRLPQGAELMSARVAGQSVRPDSGKAGEHEVILIPLIKTKPGELSYDVEVVFRTAHSALGWRASRKFNDPELVGITVEQTFWNVWLPAGWNLGRFNGNMEPVIGEVSETAKLEGAIEELKSLRKIASSVGADKAARMRALENSRALEKSLETTASRTFNAFNDMLSRDRKDFETPSTSNVSKKAAVSQNEWALGKRQELQAELKKQKMELADSNADAPVVPNAAADYSVQGLQLAPAKEPALSQTQQTVQTGRKEWNWRFNKTQSKEEPAFAVPPAEPKGAAVAAKKSLYLNDNVVLRQQEAPAQPKAMAKGGEDASKLGDEQQWKELQFGRKQAEGTPVDRETYRRQQSKEDSYAVAGKPAEAKGKADMAEKDQKASVLNTARGNIVAQQEAQSENASTANSAPSSPLSLSQTRAHSTYTLAPILPGTALPAAPSAGANTSNAGQVAGGGGLDAPASGGVGLAFRQPFNGVSDPGWVGQAGIVNQQRGSGITSVPGLMASDQSVPAAANAAADGLGLVPARPLLQPEGRLSLAIEFPTEGEVLHFKKVKGNAALELTLVKPGAYDRWLKLRAFVLLAGILWLLQKWADSRRSRRAGGGHPAGAVQSV